MAEENKTPKRQANGKAGSLGPHSEIGRKLKQYYDDLVTEEVPDRFTDLLRQLEESEQKNSGRKEGP